MVERLAFVEPISMEQFARFAEEQGWPAGDEPEDPDGDIDEDRLTSIWRTPSGDVRFVDDTIVRVQYVDNARGDVANRIRGRFACYNRDQAVAALDLDADEETVRRAFRLVSVTAAGVADEETFDVTVRGLRHVRADVRRSALEVAHYAPTTRFLPEVIRLAEQDPDRNVRQWAGSVRMLLEVIAQIENG
jgi:hypothetical protein